ncbi:hypothetical protein MW887_000967 [Aspergillus wentii]|nr:hypothetical protein MW887_000967 [Aspergillus wentii]
MVTKWFNTDALEGLCTSEQLDLLNSVDDLRSQGISHYVSLPQIIVCGDQSSGKSSVLEAISGVSFPVKSSLCTRFPTELVLRKHAQVGVRVSIVPHHSRSEAEKISLGGFSETLNSFEGLPDLIDNAKSAMGISTHGKAFANDLLRVEVSGPDRPHLTIVDLPGLIHSETRQQSASDVQLVQEVVQSYMKEPRSIILAVVSAKNDFANQIVLRLAREADQAGNRTLGVITKPDTLIPGSQSEATFVSLAKNRDVEFRLGWHVLKNMDSEAGTWTLADRNTKEIEFFAQGVWDDMPAGLVGVNALRRRLSTLLLGQIAAELPSLIHEIRSKSDACSRQLQQLGKPRTTPTEQRIYLLNLSQSFQSLVKCAVDGTYNEPFFGDVHREQGNQKRIRAVIQNINESFAERINRRGHYRDIRPSVGSSKRTEKGQIAVTQGEYIEDIKRLLSKTRGCELPGTFNPMIVRELFLEQSRPWEEIACSHVKEVWKASGDFLELAIDYIADEATSATLLREIIRPALSELREIVDQKIRELLDPHQKSHPITYNHSFAENIQRIRNEREERQITQCLESFLNVTELSTDAYFDDSIDLIGLRKSLLQSLQPSRTDYAPYEALDCMLAYYQVALKRFIDDVAVEVIETKLVSFLSNIFTPMSVFTMPDHLVQRIAGESEESQMIREELTKKLEILNKGADTCRRFVGIRSADSLIETPPRSTSSSSSVVMVPESAEHEALDEFKAVARSESNDSLDHLDDFGSARPIETEIAGIRTSGKTKKDKKKTKRAYRSWEEGKAEQPPVLDEEKDHETAY